MMAVSHRTGEACLYQGASIAFLTQHGKERAIAPLFREGLGARITVVSGYDTDRLGTFTREVPRFGDQLEAARKKASVAIELSGQPFAIASEGAFGPGPLGLGVWNRELLLFIDAKRKLEIVGHSFAPGLHEHAHVRDLEELHRVARLARFPEHGLVLRPNDERAPGIRKGLRSWRELDREFLAVMRESTNGVVFVESDLRAHVHPSRMSNIASAAADLLQRLKCRCPVCEAPGFGRVRAASGLPCRDCGAATSQARGDELGCVACPATQLRLRGDATHADAFHCSACNP